MYQDGSQVSASLFHDQLNLFGASAVEIFRLDRDGDESKLAQSPGAFDGQVP